MCCTEEERKRYNEQLLSIVNTHVAPSFAKNEKTGDHVSVEPKLEPMSRGLPLTAKRVLQVMPFTPIIPSS